MAFRLPRLRDEKLIAGERPTFLFKKWWQSVVESIESAITRIEAILDTLTGISGSITGVQVQADILDNISDLTGTGLIEKTGASAVAIRGLGAGDPANVLTRLDSDNRYNRIGQGLYVNVRSVSSTTTAASNDYAILVNASGGAVTINLPAAAAATGQVLNVKKTDASANGVTLDGNGAETIDGAATLAWTTQYQSYTVICDGTGWSII